jgi:ADP-ribosyl-[dinitrogen reductase] hydrolase
VTDDSELAIALATALAAGCSDDAAAAVPGRRRLPVEQIARSYYRWYRSPPFDCGMTCGGAFHSVQRLAATCQVVDGPGRGAVADTMLSSAAALNMRSKANGALMRASPWAVWGHRLPPDVVAAAAVLDAQLSHPNPHSCAANAAYVVAIHHLLCHERDADGAVAAARHWLVAHNERGMFDDVVQWLDDAPLALEPAEPNCGFVKIAFMHAFYHLLHASPFVDAISTTIAAGGDTDTNAAIVGGMMGAYWGVHGIPPHMVQHVLEFKPAMCHGARQRPEWLWPCQMQQLVASFFDNPVTELQPVPCYAFAAPIDNRHPSTW